MSCTAIGMPNELDSSARYAWSLVSCNRRVGELHDADLPKMCQPAIPTMYRVASFARARERFEVEEAFHHHKTILLPAVSCRPADAVHMGGLPVATRRFGRGVRDRARPLDPVAGERARERACSLLWRALARVLGDALHPMQSKVGH